MATAMVSPIARPRPSTAAPISPAPIQGSVTRRAHCESDMPRAIAPSRGSSGTPRIRSRDVAATIGITMTARMRPEVSRPWPLPVSPWKKPRPGQFGIQSSMSGEMWCAMNGPKVSAPHRPTITLGMPASNSMNMPITLATWRGSRSTMTSAAPIDTGTAMISAMIEVAIVPRISGSAPNCSPARWVMPCDFTGAAYWAPKFQVVPEKKCPPLNLMAGTAWMISVTSTKTSMSTGTTAPPRPSHLTRAPLRIISRSAAPGRRRGEAAPPAGRAAGAVAAIRSAADRVDQGRGDGLGGRRQREEPDRVEILRGVAGGEDPVQERLDGRRLGGAGLGLLHDRVLVVDDGVAGRSRGVDQRLGPRGRGGRGAGQRARCGRPGDRGADVARRPRARVLGAQVRREQERAARAVRAVQRDDLHGWQRHARVELGDRRVVPHGDLAGVDLRQHRAVEVEVLNALQVVVDHD